MDPWLAQQHEAIWQTFKCQAWHGDGQYALPAALLLQEQQNVSSIDHTMLRVPHLKELTHSLETGEDANCLNKNNYLDKLQLLPQACNKIAK